MPILCLAAKNRRRKGTKGSNTPWIPATRKRRFAISALPKWALHSCLRGDEQIQNLCWQFDRKLPTRKTHASRAAKVFAVCDARYDRRNFKQDGKQKNLLSLPAAREGFI
jgi:hypothetical protein